MKTIHGWFTLFRFVSRYIFFKLRLCSAPDVTKHYDGLLHVIGHLTKWNRYIRIRGAEHIPLDHPAVFCGNHVMLGDPLYIFKGVYDGTNKQIASRAMTRDDFFVGTPLKTRIFDMDDLTSYLGIYGISRGNVAMAQMKVFIDILLEGHCFLMFPGRTRSRSGMFFEYRSDVTEPGGASFFLGMAQRRKKELVCSVVPVSRNYNPARDHTCMIHGEEVFLPPKADRDAQRAFDFDVVERIGMLAEICVPQVVSALLYTLCLHRFSESVSIEMLTQWVNTVREASTHPYWDEEDDADLDAAVELAVRFLQKRDMLSYSNGMVTPDAEKILEVPEPEIKLMKINPVQFLTNQILHLGELTESIQDVVLSSELNA